MKKMFFPVILIVLAINVLGQTRPQLELISKGYNLTVDIYKIAVTGEEGSSTATLFQIFSCVTTNLEKMVMSETEISEFLQEDSDWLSRKNGTNWLAPLIFLTKVDGKYLVKRMYAYSEKYETFRRTYDDLSESQDWDAFCQPLVVIQRQTKKKSNT